MQVIPGFDPAATLNGTIDIGSANAGSKILLYNLSIVVIKISFENGSTALLHAGEANFWTLDGTTESLEWSQYSILATAQAACSQVTGTVYGADETILGTYPMSLTYQLNIGNSLAVASSATSIINDGNAASTSVVESTVAGDASSAVKLMNDGHLTLGNALRGGALTMPSGVNIGFLTAGDTLTNIAAGILLNALTGKKVFLGVNNVNLVQIDATGIKVLSGGINSDGGNLTTDGVSGNLSCNNLTAGGALTVSGNSELMTVDVANNQSLRWKTTGGALKRVLAGDTSNQVIVQMLDANLIIVRDVNGNELFRVNTGGIDMTQGPASTGISVGTINFTNGSITRTSKFSGTGTGTFNHNLGATPDIVLLQTHVAGSQTMGYDSETSTQVHITTGAGLAWVGLAIKF